MPSSTAFGTRRAVPPCWPSPSPWPPARRTPRPGGTPSPPARRPAAPAAGPRSTRPPWSAACSAGSPPSTRPISPSWPRWPWQPLTGAGDQRVARGTLAALDVSADLPSGLGRAELRVVGVDSFVKLPAGLATGTRPWTAITATSGNPVVARLAAVLQTALGSASLGDLGRLAGAATSARDLGPASVDRRREHPLRPHRRPGPVAGRTVRRGHGPAAGGTVGRPRRAAAADPRRTHGRGHARRQHRRLQPLRRTRHHHRPARRPGRDWLTGPRRTGRMVGCTRPWKSSRSSRSSVSPPPGPGGSAVRTAPAHRHRCRDLVHPERARDPADARRRPDRAASAPALRRRHPHHPGRFPRQPAADRSCCPSASSPSRPSWSGSPRTG